MVKTTNYPSYVTVDVPAWPAAPPSARGLHQLRDSPSHGGDLHILRRNPSVPSRNLVDLLTHEHDQLIARHLLRGKHLMITQHPINGVITAPT
jgi:hypothetical protein